MRNSHLSIVPPRKKEPEKPVPDKFECHDPFGEWVKDICERMDTAIQNLKERHA